MEFSEDFIPTKGSILKGIVSTEQSTSFISNRSKKKASEIGNSKKSKSTDKPENENEFNIKQAKREIIKFGLSGLDTRKKEEYKIQLAIKLGSY